MIIILIKKYIFCFVLLKHTIVAPMYGCRRYYRNLMGRLNFVLSIEPDNAYFRQAKETLFADGYNTDIPLNA